MDMLQTQRGKPKLSCGGYLYRKDRECNKTQKTTWRCVLRRGCPGRAYTEWNSREQRYIAHITKAHTHAPLPNAVDSLEWVEEIRRTSAAVIAHDETATPRLVDSATQLSHPSQLDHPASVTETVIGASSSSRKRGFKEEADSDDDFDLGDFSVQFEVHPNNSGYHNQGSSGVGPAPGTTSRLQPHHVHVARNLRMAEGQPPQRAVEAVMIRSDPMPEGSDVVRGYDFSEGVDYHKLFRSYVRTGFQATNVGKAIEEINKMIDCKLQPVPEGHQTEINLNPCGRERSNCTIFLSFTSNLVSAGTREIIRYLVQQNMVDCLVTTAGGIEEDFIKCLGPTYLGEFSLLGRELRMKGINRIGNLLVPNNNYCLFEDWLTPILDTLLLEQREQGVVWTPSKIINRLGKEINCADSIYYWAYKNNIPVFCPALTDGSLGDIIFFHSYKNPGLIIDLVEDVRRMNNQAMYAVNSGMIILGGGVCKHHTCNANLMRNGADFSVFVNTGAEFDGSDSGARPDEAVSWGKIKMTATPVKVYGDATVVFPILVGETFARRQRELRHLSGFD